MRIIILLVSVLVTLTSFSQSTNSKIRTYLDNLNGSEFSGAILVAQNDDIIDERAYGLSSIEYNIKNKIDTKFNIASITKMFTAVAALQLYEQGEIDLKQPIGKYLPDYPNEIVRNSVTVHQLLTHTSGLNNFYVTDLQNIRKYQILYHCLPMIPCYLNQEPNMTIVALDS